jgi:hypothetical protein
MLPTEEPLWSRTPARAPLWATVVNHDTADGGVCRTRAPEPLCACGLYVITWYDAPDPRGGASA